MSWSSILLLETGRRLTQETGDLLLLEDAVVVNVAKGLHSRLSAVTAVTNLVSTRIYPRVAPQSARMPHVVYRRLEATRTQAFGANLRPTVAMYELVISAPKYTTAKAVAEQVRLALKRWSGEAADVTIQHVFLTRENDAPWDPTLERYAVEQTYTIWYEE